MQHLGSAVQATADHERPSTGELAKRPSEQVSVLMRDELKLPLIVGAALLAISAVAVKADVNEMREKRWRQRG